MTKITPAMIKAVELHKIKQKCEQNKKDISIISTHSSTFNSMTILSKCFTGVENDSMIDRTRILQKMCIEYLDKKINECNIRLKELGYKNNESQDSL